MRQSLVKKYGLFIALMTALVGCCVLLVNLYYLERFSSASIETGSRQINEVVDRQVSRGAELTINSLAKSLAEDVYHSDFSAIENQLKVVREKNQVLYTYLHTIDGQIIHDGTAELKLYGQPISSLLPVGREALQEVSIRRTAMAIHIARPVTSAGQTLAILRIGLGNKAARQDIQSVTSTLEQQLAQLRDDVVLSSLVVIVSLLLVASLLIFVFSQQLLSPIKRLAELCRRYGNGDKEVHFQLEREDEFGQLGEALEAMKDSLTDSQQQIWQQAYLDSLTHLPNRRMFYQQLQELLTAAAARPQKVALAFIDLDHFKHINDLAGHDIGDYILQQVAQRLSGVAEQLPNMIGKSGSVLLYRIGGDEFVMILPGYDDDASLQLLAEQVEQVLQPPISVMAQRFNVSASIGITRFPEQADNLTDLVKQADIAMYEAKRTGRRQHKFFNLAMKSAVLQKIQTIDGVREALEQQQFFLTYQPIVDLADSRPMGAEVLIRWDLPGTGVVMPGDFIPVIEDTELIVPLTLWVLEQACQSLNERILPAHPEFKLSVNLSGAVMQDAEACEQIISILEKAQLPAHCLHLEITETSVMKDIDHCSQMLSRFKSLGADIWLDDFGTGYSSLSYLHLLPLDGLKIDRSFVLNIDTAGQMIRTITTLASSLQLDIVAEGIELPRQRDFIAELCQGYGQGQLYSKPLKLAQLLELLGSSRPALQTLEVL